MFNLSLDISHLAYARVPNAHKFQVPNLCIKVPSELFL